MPNDASTQNSHARATNAQTTQASARPPRSPRVLIVDEEAPLTRLLELAMRFEGWEASSVRSGGEALAAVAESAPDAILLDITLPDISGIEVASTLRARGVETPIVFVTGHSSIDDRMAAFAAGGDDYLTKPFGLEEATERLAVLFRRAGLLDSSLSSGRLVLDSETGECWCDNEPLQLTAAELEVLRVLVLAEEPHTPAQVRGALHAADVRTLDQHVVGALESLLARETASGHPLLAVDEHGGWSLPA